MRFTYVLIVALTAIVNTGCKDKYEKSLDEVTEAAYAAKICELKITSIDDSCLKFSNKLEISLDKARILGINDKRIEAAANIGAKSAELIPADELRMTNPKPIIKWDSDAVRERNKGWSAAENGKFSNRVECVTLSNKNQIDGCLAYIESNSKP